MAQVQVRAITLIRVSNEHGSLTTYHPGDWLQVGKQKAVELIENGQAEIPQEADVKKVLGEDLSDCGVYLRSGTIKEAREMLHGLKVDILEYSGALRLPFERTLIWRIERPLERRQIALGFARVEDTGRYSSWEMAAMLRGPEMLASDIGEMADHRKTREIIGDLRVPLYETSALWVRRTNATEKMIAVWDAEMQESECEEHAFLRALYSNRVLLCTLPAGWLRRIV